jgi:hypothetical protein
LTEPLDVTLQVVAALERLEVPYFIGGSMASAMYGLVRATIDVDMIADLGSNQVDSFVAILGDDFYADAEMIRSAIKHQGSFNLIHLETMFKVDIFIIKNRAYDQQQLLRRVNLQLTKDPLSNAYVASPEDIILSKLEWYRLGGGVSDRQWKDVLNVIRVQSGSLDLPYLHQWADELGIFELLQRAINEASEPDHD